MGNVPEGWYPDTAHPGMERLWLGTEWADEWRAVVDLPLPPPPVPSNESGNVEQESSAPDVDPGAFEGRTTSAEQASATVGATDPRLTPSAGAGWYPDPVDPYVYRYWSGQTWDEKTGDHRLTQADRDLLKVARPESAVKSTPLQSRPRLDAEGVAVAGPNFPYLTETKPEKPAPVEDGINLRVVAVIVVAALAVLGVIVAIGTHSKNDSSSQADSQTAQGGNVPPAQSALSNEPAGYTEGFSYASSQSMWPSNTGAVQMQGVRAICVAQWLVIDGDYTVGTQLRNGWIKGCEDVGVAAGMPLNPG